MSEQARPDPDALLAKMREDDNGRGRLKIFLGMCPGVGKTYAMLLAAQQRQEEGVDTVIGVLETHGRIETQAVAAGLHRIPARTFTHRGLSLQEMDLDAILARKPDLVLVDELAHSNLAGGRHPKRYQDVLEILDAGIDVYTTVNIQHIESHSDVVSQFTGVPVHETVPDTVLDGADEIELIDLSPDELRKRLEEGKVYLGPRAAAAAENFFRVGNLKALREVALRVTAELADKELQTFLHDNRSRGYRKTRERLLVAVGPSPYSEPLIRWTRRMATASHGSWMALYVDTGTVLDPVKKSRLEANLTLARTLGAEVLMTSGADVTDALIRTAQEHHVSQIVIGKPLTPRVVDFLRGGSLVDKLIRKSGDIDIYVVRADKKAAPWRPSLSDLNSRQILRECGIGAAIVLTVTLAGLLLAPSIGYMAVGLLYLLAVLGASTTLSALPIFFTATLTALAWNFLFIQPLYTFAISNIHDAILFGTYFVVAIITGQLHARMHRREASERRREEQATALYRFTSEIAASRTLDEALSAGVRSIESLFDVRAAVLNDRLDALVGVAPNAKEIAVADWSLKNRKIAGRFTDTLPQSTGLYLPLQSSEGAFGVLSITTERPLSLQERQLLETFSVQIALLLERAQLKLQTERVELEARSRQLQKTLLDSISHEFKTPLSVITTAVESITPDSPTSVPLLEEIRIATDRLTRVVGNLLDMTRIETGSVRPVMAWCDLSDLIDQSVERIASELGARTVEVKVDASVSACSVDAGLLQEVFCNLLRNAAQNSPNGSIISIHATSSQRGMNIIVRDQGRGIREEEAVQIFDKFHRGGDARPGGLGLGLSIVRGFVEAHGGSIQSAPRMDGRDGVEFHITLPVATRAIENLANAP